MSDGFAYIYLDKRYAYYSFSFLQGYLNCSGISVENPTNGIISMWTDNDDDIAGPLEVLINHIATESKINFQWWFAACEDLYCRFRFLEQNVCIELGLDGLDEQQNIVACNACIALLRSLISLHAGIGLVADRWGGSVENDWDSIFLRQQQFPMTLALPDLLFFKQSSNCFDNIRDHYAFVEEYRGFRLMTDPHLGIITR